MREKTDLTHRIVGGKVTNSSTRREQRGDERFGWVVGKWREGGGKVNWDGKIGGKMVPSFNTEQVIKYVHMSEIKLALPAW